MTLTVTPISMSVKEAAARIGISQRKAYYLASVGELPGSYRMGGRILVHVPTLDAWMEAKATQVSQRTVHADSAIHGDTQIAPPSTTGSGSTSVDADGSLPATAGRGATS